MSRPSRNRKTVNYSDFQDDDDEDFASVKPPPKKVRTTDPEPAINSKTANTDETVELPSPAIRKREALDNKQYERDMEAALTLSLMETSNASETQSSTPEAKTNAHSAANYNEYQPPLCLPPVLIHCNADVSHSEGDDPPQPDCPPVLSNCIIDGRILELNQISVESSSLKDSKQTKASEKQKKALKDNSEDDDYKPQNTPESESDADFSAAEGSEDETFSVKKKPVKQNTRKKTTPPPKEKKEKKPAKALKAKSSAVSPVVCRSPVTSGSGSKRMVCTPPPPLSKSALCSNQTGARLPKWTPPGQVGQSPESSHNNTVRSPGQGLRLGLSRLARVKPLHPNVAAS
ncbi:hypothetical protein DNTS_001490 [Danionella cerebrum]|uniref:RAD51 interacting motif domain-containing protein n=1 Tax=Danionella cerebrum TaxID=2873325 RepID=A0A553RGI7_9TELE|nr:hypothetical protein DNTS_001490 [Danionella translucida]